MAKYESKTVRIPFDGKNKNFVMWWIRFKACLKYPTKQKQKQVAKYESKTVRIPLFDGKNKNLSCGG
jgi:hypothetical protein